MTMLESVIMLILGAAVWVRGVETFNFGALMLGLGMVIGGGTALVACILQKVVG